MAQSWSPAEPFGTTARDCFSSPGTRPTARPPISMASMDMPPPASAPAGALSARPRGSKSPMDRRNISPYLNTASISPGKVSPKGKGTHISTIKSLGLLHDLQEYISNVEAVTVEQKLELSRLKDEKREIEKAVYKLEVQADKSHASDFFRASELADLPPKLRAIFEENKIMKEKLRKHKGKMATLEQQVSAKNTQIIALEDSITLLKQQLAACSRTPADVEREEALKDQLMTKERRISTLEHEVSVLKQKLETDSKLHRQTLQGAKREQESIKKQVVLAHATLEEQDKELRAARLEIKRLSRFLAPSRGSPTRSLHQSHTEADMHQVLHDRAAEHVYTAVPAASAQAAPQAAPASDGASVHLMICLLRDEDGKQPPSGMITLSPPVPASRPVPPPPAAAPSQPEPSLGDINMVSTPQESQTSVAPVEVEPAQPRTELEEAADKVVAAFRLAHSPSDSQPGAAQEAPQETAPPPEQQDLAPVPPQQHAEAAPPETHASAPRSVPYSRTAARAESRKSMAEGKPPISKQPSAQSSLGHKNSQGSKSGSKQASENGSAKGSLRNSRSSSQTGQGKSKPPLSQQDAPVAPAAPAEPSAEPPAESPADVEPAPPQQVEEQPAPAAEPEPSAAPEAAPELPGEGCEMAAPTPVEEHVDAAEQQPEAQTEQEQAEQAEAEASAAAPEESGQAEEAEQSSEPAAAEEAAAEPSAAEEPASEAPGPEEQTPESPAAEEQPSEAPAADEQPSEAPAAEEQASEPAAPPADAEADAAQPEAQELVEPDQPEPSGAEQGIESSQAEPSGEASAAESHADAASAHETEKVSFLSSTASDIDTIHSNEAPAHESSAPEAAPEAEPAAHAEAEASQEGEAEAQE